MMTLNEYSLRMEVYKLQRIDKEEQIAMMAFYNQLAQSTTGGKNPRVKFDTFEKLFNREEAERTVRKTYGDEYILESSKKHDSFAERMKQFEKLKQAGKIDKNAWKKAVNSEGGGQ